MTIERMFLSMLACHKVLRTRGRKIIRLVPIWDKKEGEGFVAITVADG